MQVQWQAAVDAVGLPVVVAIVTVVVLLLVLVAILWSRRGHRVPVDDRAESVAPKAGETSAGLRAGLAKTRSGILQRLLPLLGRERLDAEVVEALETVLLSADVGVRTTERLIRRLQDEPGEATVPLPKRLEREVLTILDSSTRRTTSDAPSVPGRPHVIMVIGVNGVGKTTSIGKLAARFVEEGKRTLLVAGDTVRAAAIEQLTVWAERSGADLVRQQHGGDPGAVAFDGLRAAFTHEAAFRQEVLIAVILVPAAVATHASGAGKAMMVASVLLVLVVELLNSGIEAVTDRISLEDHALAKRAKDLGSAAVMLSLINVPVAWLLTLLLP